MKKAVGYSRYSSASQSETSIEVQKNAIEEYCSQNGIELIKHYSDYAISGQSADMRLQFLQMIQDISQGGIDFVVVYTRDRFSRSMKDFVKYLQIMKDVDCELKCANGDSDENNPSGKLSNWILMSLSQYYIENLKREVVRGLRYNAHHAIWNNKPPFGYDRDKTSGKLVINPIEAKAVKRIFILLSEGYKSPTIVKILYDEGYRRKDGTTIKHGVIDHILDNKTYIGEYKYCIKGTNPEEVIIPGGVPAIVEMELYENTIKEISKIKIKKKQNVIKTNSAFNNKLICGYTFKSLHKYVAKYDTEFNIPYEYYRVTNVKRGEKTCEQISAKLIENFVEVLITKIILGERNKIQVIHFLKMYVENTKTYLYKLHNQLLDEKKELECKLYNYISLITKNGNVEELLSNIREAQNELNGINSLISINEPRLKAIENFKNESVELKLNELSNYVLYAKDKVFEYIIDSIILYDDLINVRFKAKAFLPMIPEDEYTPKNVFSTNVDRKKLEEIMSRILHYELDFNYFDFKRVLD